MLGDIGQPELVRSGSCELVSFAAVLVDDDAEVVVNGGAGLLAILAALLPEHGPPAVRRRDPPCCPVRHRLALVAGFVGKEAIPELRVVAVGVEQGVRPIRLIQVPLTHGVTPPAVIRLASKLQNPARHHDGNPVRGELAYERVEPFPGR